MNQQSRLKPYNTVIDQLNEISVKKDYTYTLTPDQYHGSYTKVLCKCNKCSTEWETQLCNLLNAKTSCKYCYGRNKNSNGRPKKYTLEYIIQKLDELSLQNNYSYQLPEIVENCHNTRINCTCNKCNHQWTTTPYSLIKQGTGCKLCYLKNRGGRSVQEDEIISIIKSINPNINIIKNHKILDVPFSKYKHEVDIHIPELNKAIEFNDSSHNNADAKRRTKGYCNNVEEWHNIKSESFKSYSNGKLIHINGKEWDDMSDSDKHQYIKSLIFD